MGNLLVELANLAMALAVVVIRRDRAHAGAAIQNRSSWRWRRCSQRPARPRAAGTWCRQRIRCESGSGRGLRSEFDRELSSRAMHNHAACGGQAAGRGGNGRRTQHSLPRDLVDRRNADQCAVGGRRVQQPQGRGELGTWIQAQADGVGRHTWAYGEKNDGRGNEIKAGTRSGWDRKDTRDRRHGWGFPSARAVLELKAEI